MKFINNFRNKIKFINESRNFANVPWNKPWFSQLVDRKSTNFASRSVEKSANFVNRSNKQRKNHVNSTILSEKKLKIININNRKNWISSTGSEKIGNITQFFRDHLTIFVGTFLRLFVKFISFLQFLSKFTLLLQSFDETPVVFVILWQN